MEWKAKYTKAEYSHGTTRLKRVFAWRPTYIDGFVVWLSTYEILQAYIITTVAVSLEGNNTSFANGEWQNLSKRRI